MAAAPSVETLVDIGGRRVSSLALGSDTPAVVSGVRPATFDPDFPSDPAARAERRR